MVVAAAATYTGGVGGGGRLRPVLVQRVYNTRERGLYNPFVMVSWREIRAMACSASCLACLCSRHVDPLPACLRTT